MGADSFAVKVAAKTPKEAFRKAVEEAFYDHGHGGYTGSIAEKDSFIMISVPEGKDPEDYAEELVNNDDPRIDDKWGPAGCILCHKYKEGDNLYGQMLDKGENIYLFFGWASS